MRVIDFFDRGAFLYPDRVALISNGERLTYAKLRTISREIGCAIASRPGSDVPHVSILSRNHPLAVQAMIGVFRAGAAWVPANPLNTFETNAAVLAYADTEWLFYHSEFADLAPRYREAVPTLRHFVCLDRDDDDAPSLERFRREEGQGESPIFPVDSDRVCGIFPTGGTTGPSKAVVHTFRVWSTLLALAAVHLRLDTNPIFLGVTPMTHAAGIMSYVMTPFGGTMIFEDGFDPERWCRAVEDHRVTHTFLPPTALYVLLAQPGVRDHDFSSLRCFCIGGAPVSPDKMKEAVEVFGPCMTQLYGQAEAPGFLTSLSPEEIAAAARGDKPHLLKSCGRPTFLARVGIMDDEGNLLGPRQTGEIVSQSFLNAPGYYKKPEATDEIRTFGWHHTGDVGHHDEEGYFYISDRKKDMIITGGFNVFSAEVEQAILTIGAVQDCAVIGVPDDKWGEAVTAVVELKCGHETTADEIVLVVKSQIGSVKAPKRVDFVTALPRTPNGKVDKKEIRERYWKGQSRQVH